MSNKPFKMKYTNGKKADSSAFPFAEIENKPLDNITDNMNIDKKGKNTELIEALKKEDEAEVEINKIKESAGPKPSILSEHQTRL